jgi:leader peptidase (prepilin peptidase)/N-methyltransferase
MSADFALIAGATIGMAVGGILIPTTRRELAAAMTRANAGGLVATPTLLKWQRLALIAASGVVPGLVLAHVGFEIVAIPTLLMFLGLVQLAYCDAKRRLLPKTMVYATTACVATSALAVAAVTNQWHRLLMALLCSAVLFIFLFAINLMNPAWMAFGDVRLAPVVGLGLAWDSPMVLLQAFLLANVMVAVVGIIMMLTRGASRKVALPFGFYLTLASGAIILLWN